MSNDLATYQLSDMQTMAVAVAKSGLFGMKTPEQALALMLVAQSENMHPATITQDYDIIQGKVARKTHSVLARFQKMGGTCEWHELTDRIADATFSHKSGGALRITWTFEQAQKAGLTGKDNWKNYPRAMLRARCIAEGVRAVYPAAIGGMMVVEEAQDTTADRDAPTEPKHMGRAELVQPDPPKAPPAWPADKWASGLPKWVDGIAHGKPIADVLAWLGSKARVTPEQEQELRAAVARLQQQTAAPAVDADHLAQTLQDAQDLDKVYELGGLIDAITDEAQRLRLQEIFNARCEALE